MSMLKNLRLRSKINLFVLIGIIGFALIITVAVKLVVTDRIEKLAMEKANSDLHTIYA